MPDDDQATEERPISIAEALKEGVKTAGTQSVNTVDDIDGASKAAVVLLAVGPDAAADVLRNVSPFEVQKISGKMAIVRSLPREVVVQVLREFREATADGSQVAFDTDSFMQNMLHKALGTEGASDLLGKLESAIDMSGVESLKRMEPDVLYEMIKNEHPQIIATVMVFLDPQQAAMVTKLFPDEIRDELMLRVALLQKVQPAALKELNEVMSRSAESGSDTRRSNVGGVTPTAEILNYLSGGMDQAALNKIKEYDAELAQMILEQMFTFEDLRPCCSRFRPTCWSSRSKGPRPSFARSSSRTWPVVRQRPPRKTWRPVVRPRYRMWKSSKKPSSSSPVVCRKRAGSISSAASRPTPSCNRSVVGLRHRGCLDLFARDRLPRCPGARGPASCRRGRRQTQRFSASQSLAAALV